MKPLSPDVFKSAFSWTPDGFSVSGLQRADSEDVHDYEVMLNPFGVRQLTNGALSAETSAQPYFENRTTGQAYTPSGTTCFDALADSAQKRSGMDIYGQDTTSLKQAISLSFFLPGDDQTLYGIPEREDTLALKITTGTDPYELFATDHLHSPNEVGPLYGSVPYVMGLSAQAATGLLWVNSAKTTIDID